ncbi:MAG: tetratricopeptide repeat protein [Actinomycetota bacterium]
MGFFKKPDPPRPAPSPPGGVAGIQFIMPKGLGWTVEDVYTLEARGRWEEALGRWQQLLAPFHDPVVADRIQDFDSHRHIWLHLGLCARHLGRYDEALRSYERAEELARRAGDVRFQAEAINCIGVVHRNAGRPDTALEDLRRALPMAESLDDAALTATLHDNIALSYADQGQLEQARAASAAAAELVESAGPRITPDVRERVLENLGSILILLGRREEGEALLRRALDEAARAGLRAAEERVLAKLR